MSRPRCALLFFLHSEPGQDASARRSVCPTGAFSSPTVQREVFVFQRASSLEPPATTEGVETPLFARTQGGKFDGARHRCFWS